MPPVSRLAIRVALIYLLVGTGLGAWRLAAMGADLPSPGWIGELHRQLVLSGWLAQTALGTAYGILPRGSAESPRGSIRLAWAALGLLNTGLLIIASGLVLFALPAAVLTGRILANLGLGLFAVLLWPRIRAFGATSGGARGN